MIEQTFYFALASNWLFMLSAYQEATKPRYKRNPNRDESQRPEPPKIATNMTFGSPEATEYGISYEAWVKDVNAWDKANPVDFQTNWFARKPFTCMYCLTFWLALLGSALIPFLTGWGEFTPGVAFTSPVAALIVSQVIKRLGVTI